MTSFTSLKTLALVATLATAGAANAATLYTQPWDGSGTAYSSQNDVGGGNGNYATVYDNFTLGSGATVTGVNFKGGYFNPSTAAALNGFTIKFYANNAGVPGTALSTFNIAGNGGESGCALAGGLSLACNYSAAVNFAATAGTQYWMSIVANVNFPPQWGWESGTGGNGTAYQVFQGVGAPLAADLAFTLTGTNVAGVPEPATWALMLGGFGLVGAAMRRRARPTVSFA